MIAIIDYDAGNLTSVARAVSHIGFECVVTNRVKDIENAERIIFPGVGAAGSAMESLKRLRLDFIIRENFDSGKPILGICLGTQIIMTESQEDGGTACLGIIPGKTRAFPHPLRNTDQARLKIPHMGWNSVCVRNNHPVLSDLGNEDEFYFVHSFYPHPDNSDYVIGETDYGITFASVIGFRNLLATQFHPEKSGRPGLTMLKNFCMWNGKL